MFERSTIRPPGLRGKPAVGVSLAGGDELFGAVQTLVGMMRGDRRLIVQVAGVTGGEGASTVAAGLAHAVSDASGFGVYFVSLSNDDEAGDGFAVPAFDEGGARTAPPDAIWTGVVRGYLPRRSWPNVVAGGLAAELGGLPESIGLIVIDTAPVLRSLEACAFCGQTDGVLLVLEDGTTTYAEAAEAREAVERAGGRVFGVVINKRRYSVPAFIARPLGMASRRRRHQGRGVGLAVVLAAVAALGLGVWLWTAGAVGDGAPPAGAGADAPDAPAGADAQDTPAPAGADAQ